MSECCWNGEARMPVGGRPAYQTWVIIKFKITIRSSIVMMWPTHAMLLGDYGSGRSNSFTGLLMWLVQEVCLTKSLSSSIAGKQIQ